MPTESRSNQRPVMQTNSHLLVDRRSDWKRGMQDSLAQPSLDMFPVRRLCFSMSLEDCKSRFTLGLSEGAALYALRNGRGGFRIRIDKSEIVKKGIRDSAFRSCMPPDDRQPITEIAYFLCRHSF